MSEEVLEELKLLDRYQRLPSDRLDQLAEIVLKLRRTKLFEPLNTAELAYIAEKGRPIPYPAGEAIIRKGATDKTFYVISGGQVRVWEEDDRGRPHLLNYHPAGDFFGELALLDNAPRAANVDAVSDVEVIAFDQEGFERIVAYNKIADYMREWGQQRIAESNRPFPGKHWDEITIFKTHKSWLALFYMVLFPASILLLTLIGFVLLAVFSAASLEILISIVLAIAVGIGLWTFWTVEDWRNDDLILTSKRVISIERILVPPFPVERHEAAIGQVIDVTTRTHGLWTYWFNIRTIEIKTAGGRVILFPYVAEPDQIREKILQTRELEHTRTVGEERSRIRQRLLSELNRPVSQIKPMETGPVLQVTPEREGLQGLLDWFVPRQRVVRDDRIIWRKHWFVLLKAVAPALFLILLSVILFILILTEILALPSVPWTWMLVLPIAGLVAGILWYLWNYSAWRNDVYIVTNERIIDIEGSPFHLFKESTTEGPFDTIQNIDYSSPNLFYRILSLGNVRIHTAAKQNAFTFDSVPHPVEVQQEIFQRLIDYRERRARQEAERQYGEFSKWFATYHHSVVEQKE